MLKLEEAMRCICRLAHHTCMLLNHIAAYLYNTQVRKSLAAFELCSIAVIPSTMSFFEPTQKGFTRHRLAVTVISGAMLFAAIGATGYGLFSAGSYMYRQVTAGPSNREVKNPN